MFGKKRVGYDEGYADGLKSGPSEGFDFGHEVAFLKFLPLGIVLGHCTIWKHNLSSQLTDAKKTRAIKLIEELEKMILSLNRCNEAEADHGKFDAMKRRIMSKNRIVESLLGEERVKIGPNVEEEDHIALAKRMDMELQL